MTTTLRGPCPRSRKVSGQEVAGVVAAEGVAQRRLRGWVTIGAAACARKALAQDALHGGEIRAGLESGRRAEAVALKITLVDLAKANAVVPTCRFQCGNRGHCLGKVGWLAHKRPADDADGKWIAAALDLDERACRVLCHQRRASQHEGSQVDHPPPPSTGAATAAAASAAGRACRLLTQAA